VAGWAGVKCPVQEAFRGTQRFLCFAALRGAGLWNPPSSNLIDRPPDFRVVKPVEGRPRIVRGHDPQAEERRSAMSKRRVIALAVALLAMVAAGSTQSVGSTFLKVDISGTPLDVRGGGPLRASRTCAAQWNDERSAIFTWVTLDVQGRLQGRSLGRADRPGPGRNGGHLHLGDGGRSGIRGGRRGRRLHRPLGRRRRHGGRLRAGALQGEARRARERHPARWDRGRHAHVRAGPPARSCGR
jgi:hypothetical protein